MIGKRPLLYRVVDIRGMLQGELHIAFRATHLRTAFGRLGLTSDDRIGQSVVNLFNAHLVFLRFFGKRRLSAIIFYIIPIGKTVYYSD